MRIKSIKNTAILWGKSVISQIRIKKKQKTNIKNIENQLKARYIIHALAKSNAEPGNSNYISTANSSTPLTRAFFVCSVRTPQIDLSRDRLFSMVAYCGKGLALCCVPLIAVFQLVIRYRPSLETLAVTLEKFINGVTPMIYQFLGISRQHYNQNKAEQIRIIADNETQAKAFLARDYVLIPLGRLPNTAKNNRTLEIKGACYA